MILFKNPCDMAQISVLSRQVFPHKAAALAAVFNNELKLVHSYILLDFKQATPDHLRFRSLVITPHNRIVFIPN